MPSTHPKYYFFVPAFRLIVGDAFLLELRAVPLPFLRPFIVFFFTWGILKNCRCYRKSINVVYLIKIHIVTIPNPYKQLTLKNVPKFKNAYQRCLFIIEYPDLTSSEFQNNFTKKEIRKSINYFSCKFWLQFDL